MFNTMQQVKSFKTVGFQQKYIGRIKTRVYTSIVVLYLEMSVSEFTEYRMHLCLLYGCVCILALSLGTNMKSLSDSSLPPVFIKALTF